MNSHSTSSPTAALSSTERASLIAILSVFVMRMLGLFMLLPVLALYASTLHGATPLLVGLTVGAYGISQALLQIPFGWASDHYGRRRMLVIGLVIFALGSLVAAMSDSVQGVIAGRILQGAGAISAVLTALLGDVIAAEKRTRAMAVIGIGIGMSFLLSLMLGPLISAHVGVSGLFIVSFGLAVLAMGVTLVYLPSPPVIRDASRLSLGPVLKDTALWRLNIGIFALHFVLAALFVALPFVLRDQLAIAAASQWKTLGLVLLLSIPGTVLLIRAAERLDVNAEGVRNKHTTQGLAITLIMLSMLLLTVAASEYFALTPTVLVILVALFFSAFNFMEARLPAQVSIAAGDSHRGAALGVYASCQFLGVFAGGAAAGWVMGMFGLHAAFALSAGAAVLWLVVHFKH